MHNQKFRKVIVYLMIFVMVVSTLLMGISFIF